MSLQSPHQSRIERLINITRVLMAIEALVSGWLDLSQTARYARIAYAALSCYLVYALAVALPEWQAVVFRRRLKLITHSLDLAYCSLLIYFIEGSDSPFVVYFVLSLGCARPCWQWYGTLWTTLTALTVFIGIKMYAATVLQDSAFELHRVVIRAIYLAMPAALLRYLCAVAHQIIADLDQFYRSRRLQQAAVIEERLRLARNLHDGLLQLLTGMNLQMAAARHLLEENLHAARDHLLEIQRLVLLETPAGSCAATRQKMTNGIV